MEVSGQSHMPAALYLENNTRYPLNTGLGWPQSRCRRFAEEKNLLPHPRLEPRVDRAKKKRVLMRCGSRNQRKNTRYHWREGWVDPTVGLGIGRQKPPCSGQDSNTFHKCLPPTYLYPVYLINATDMLYPVQTLCFRMRLTLWRLS